MITSQYMNTMWNILSSMHTDATTATITISFRVCTTKWRLHYWKVRFKYFPWYRNPKNFGLLDSGSKSLKISEDLQHSATRREKARHWAQFSSGTFSYPVTLSCCSSPTWHPCTGPSESGPVTATPSGWSPQINLQMRRTPIRAQWVWTWAAVNLVNMKQLLPCDVVHEHGHIILIVGVTEIS